MSLTQDELCSYSAPDLTWVHQVVTPILQPRGDVIVLTPQMNKHFVTDGLQVYDY